MSTLFGNRQRHGKLSSAANRHTHHAQFGRLLWIDREHGNRIRARLNKSCKYYVMRACQIEQHIR